MAERLNRTLLEKIQAMLHDSDLLKFLWAEATVHAVYLKNRMWTRTIGDTTPFELLNGRKPNVGNLHPWGCKVQVHNTTGSKLDGCSSVRRWVGFDAKNKDGHRIYWPDRKTVTVERSVRFNFEPEEVVVGVLPLEGERKVDKRSMTIESEKHDVEAPVPDAKTGRGHRIRKETEYMKLLKGGLGVTGTRMGEVLPRGMQPGSTIAVESEEDVDQATAVSCEPEIDYAMATVFEIDADI